MAETEAEFVEREWGYLTEGQQREPRWKRLFALAHRGAGLTLDRQRHVVKEDHSHWIKETYSRYVPIPSPPAGEPE